MFFFYGWAAASILEACLDTIGDDYIQTTACVSPPHNAGKPLVLSPYCETLLDPGK